MLLNFTFAASKRAFAFYSTVVILLLSYSCKEKDQIGVGLQPDSQIGVIYTDTTTLITESILLNDSIITSGQELVLTGSFEDNIFGNVEARAYTQFVQQAENRNVSGITVDSVVLKLNYVYHYGDSGQYQTMKVYEITSDIYKDSIYKSIQTSNIPSISAALDFDQAFKASPSKKTQRILLNNSFGNRIINDIIGTGISNTDLKNSFKGIALIPKTAGEGVVMGLTLDNNTKIVIYGKNGSVKDSVTLSANTDHARFYTITSNRTAATDIAISSLSTNGKTHPTNGALYVQSGIGIRTRIKIPSLSTFKSKVGNVAINRAELLVEYNDDDKSDPIASYPTPTLRLLKLNGDGSIKKYLSGSTYAETPIVMDNLQGLSDPYTVGYNTTANAYSFDISSYIHSVIYGLEPNNGIIVSSPPNAIRLSTNRTIVAAGKVKLKIYYTKVN